MVGEHLVIGEAGAGERVRGFGGGLQGEQGGTEAGPAFASEQGRVVPFGEVRGAFDGLAHGAAEFALRQAGGHRPDRVDRGDGVGLGGGDGVGRVAHGQAAAEFLHPAADDQFGAGVGAQQGAEAGFLPNGEFGQAGGVADADTPGVGGARGRVVADDFDRPGDDLTRQRVAQGGAGAAVDEAFRQMEQQVADTVAAGQALQLLRAGGADAAQ